ncbi:MAG: YraN family protein [Nocardioides sp.]
MTMTQRQRSSLGAYGESVAARHLVAQGMVLLDRNWRCDVGEVDLVLREGPVLVVCEVKTRRDHAFGSPHEAVSPTKAARLQLLAARWAEERGLRPPEVRIDVVAVVAPAAGAAEVDHVRGVA